MHTIRGTTRLLALLGHPVAHSLSPAMHNAALEKHGLDLVYAPLDVSPEDLPAAIAGLRAMKFLGANVTLPHKQSVLPLLDEVSVRARKLGAVNTIVNRNGKLYGETTDAAGFVAAFEDKGHSFSSKSVAIIGSGGSARTIALALPDLCEVKRITLVARSASKAKVIVDEARKHNPDLKIAALSFEEYASIRGDHDIVVNATPVGMVPAVNDTPLPKESLDARQIVYDIVYNPRETRLLREAKARGCSVVDGLGMLVYQGKISFEMWTGKNVPAKDFYEGIQRQGFFDGSKTT